MTTRWQRLPQSEGDLTLSNNIATVIGVNGLPTPDTNPALSPSGVFYLDPSLLRWSLDQPYGDIHGPYPGLTVTGFYGIPLDTNSPLNGQVYAFSASTGHMTFMDTNSIIGPLGGDVSGPYLSNTVTKVNGNLAFSCVPNVVLIGKSLGAGTSVTATVSGGVATVTHSTHGYASNDVVVMTGATSSGSIGDFNTLKVITVVDANTYTFVTTATGTISTPKELFWFAGNRALNPTLISTITRSGAGTFPVTLTNTQADAYYGIVLTSQNSRNSAQGAYVNAQSVTNTGFTAFVGDMGAGGGTYTGEDPTGYICIKLTGII